MERRRRSRYQPRVTRPGPSGGIDITVEVDPTALQSGRQSAAARFVLKELQDVPCWGTDGELGGRGCGVGAEW